MDNPLIPLSVPNLKGNELNYVTEAVKSEWVSSGGPYIVQFEKDITQYIDTPAVACQSGTAGIHLSLIALEIGLGDEVIAPTLTFIASINPIAYVGAKPVFMDCDDSLCIDPDKLETFCEHECLFKNHKLYNKKTGAQIKALIVVHVFGNMADMERIMDIAEKYNLFVIEDAAEAVGSYYTGGKYKDEFAGTIGDIGIFSFNGNKIITTGGGGMVVSKNERLTKKIRHLSTQAKADELYFIHDEVGYNYRMTNLQAALGVAQLEQLEQFISIKKRNYMLYQQEIFGTKGLSLLEFRRGIRPNYWFYSLVLDRGRYPMDRDELIQYLQEHNVQSRPIWGLINEQKPYANHQSYHIEKAKYYHNRIVNIPCSSSLTETDVKRVASLITKQA